MIKLKLLSGAAALVLAAQAAVSSAAPLAIEHVTLIDGTNRPPQKDMTVVIDGDRFVRVAPSAVLPDPPGKRIDGRGRYLIPGLVDVHIHLKGRGGGDGRRMVGVDPKRPNGNNAPASNAGIGGPDRNAGIGALAGYLYSGVTAVYDAGNDPKHTLTLRADERAGRILSPRIFATGNLVTYPGSHGSQMAVEIDSWPEDKPLLDKYLAEQKPDVVKLTLEEHGWGTRPLIPLLPTDLMQEIVKYVNLHGIRTTAHTSSELRAIDAIYAGIDSLAHPVIQGPITDDFAKLMGAKKIPMGTTLTIGEGYSRLVEHPEYLDQPLYAATLSKDEITELRTKTVPAWKERGWTWWMKLMTPIAQDNMRKIHEAGGVIAIGTDQTLGPAVHREMELLQAAGIKPLDIITIATLNGAKHLGVADKLGSVEEGKLADAVLLGADPSTDVNNAKSILLVIKNGEPVDESKLPLPGGARPKRLAN